MTIKEVKSTIERVKAIVSRVNWDKRYEVLEEQLSDLKGNAEVVNVAFKEMRQEILDTLDENVENKSIDERIMNLIVLDKKMQKLYEQLDDIIYLFFEYDDNFEDLEITLRNIEESKKAIVNARKELEEEKKQSTKIKKINHARIEKSNNNTFFVKMDSERFGQDAIMFESFSFVECLKYLVRIGKTDDMKRIIKELFMKHKQAQYKKFESCLIHLFSCVVVGIEIFENENGNSYITLTNSRYKMVMGLDNELNLIRKPKNLVQKMELHNQSI